MVVLITLNNKDVFFFSIIFAPNFLNFMKNLSISLDLCTIIACKLEEIIEKV